MDAGRWTRADAEAREMDRQINPIYLGKALGSMAHLLFLKEWIGRQDFLASGVMRIGSQVLSPSIFWGSRFFSRRLRSGLRAINLGPQKIDGLSICDTLVVVKRGKRRI